MGGCVVNMTVQVLNKNPTKAKQQQQQNTATCNRVNVV